jgi:hypothetical protein
MAWQKMPSGTYIAKKHCVWLEEIIKSSLIIINDSDFLLVFFNFKYKEKDQEKPTIAKCKV